MRALLELRNCVLGLKTHRRLNSQCTQKESPSHSHPKHQGMTVSSRNPKNGSSLYADKAGNAS